VFMWLLLTFVWSLYISALLACLLEAAGWPKSPCAPIGSGRYVRVEVTVNEWVPGAFVLQVKFEREGGAVANGTIPLHVYFATSSTVQCCSYTGTQGLLTHSIMWDLCCLGLINIAVWTGRWWCNTLEVVSAQTPNYTASSPRMSLCKVIFEHFIFRKWYDFLMRLFMSCF
jgi:hypothetical protein